MLTFLADRKGSVPQKVATTDKRGRADKYVAGITSKHGNCTGPGTTGREVAVRRTFKRRTSFEM